MKQILIALLLAFTTSTVINAQKQSSIEKDSTENVKVTLSKKTDTKADESNTTVTVIGVDTTDMDTTAGKDDNDLPFGNLSDTISGGILISIIAIVAVFGLPVFLPLQEPESPLPPCRTGHCSRTTAAGKLYP